jgi:hypothetical protein
MVTKAREKMVIKIFVINLFYFANFPKSKSHIIAIIILRIANFKGDQYLDE